MNIALDAHAHLVPVQHKRLTRFAGIEWSPETEKFSVDGHVIGVKDLFRPQALLDWMQDCSIEHAWIAPPPPLFRPHLETEEAGAWARVLTEGLDELAEPLADRLTTVCFLPIEHPAEAARIASERIEAGGRLFTASTGGGTLILSGAAYNDLWQVLSDGGALLFLHPGETPDSRLDPFYLTNLVGNPHETAIAGAHLVFGGILARYSGMRVLLSHGGGSIPALAGRWEQGFLTTRPGIDTSLPSPQTLLRGVLADCVVHSVAGLRAASDTFGAGNIVFGSDWPFPMGLLKPHRQLPGSDCLPAVQANSKALRSAYGKGTR